MDVMTVQEAAAVLGVEGSVIRRRLLAGTMKGHKVNERLWLIPRREVERWRKMGPLPLGRKPKTKSRTPTAAPGPEGGTS